jgi:hypothetical protein
MLAVHAGTVRQRRQTVHGRRRRRRMGLTQLAIEIDDLERNDCAVAWPTHAWVPACLERIEEEEFEWARCPTDALLATLCVLQPPLPDASCVAAAASRDVNV